MIVRIDRDVIAQAVIIVTLCIGGWMMFVQPRVQQMSELEDLIARHQVGPGGLEQSAVESIAREAGALRRRLNGIEHANSLGQDSSQLYAMLMDVARRHNVFVHTLNPGTQASVTSSGVQVRQVSMSVEGDFEQVTLFLDAVNVMPGFLRPAFLALVPQENEAGRPVVVANLGYEVLTFAMPDPLAAMSEIRPPGKGDGHVQP